MALDVMRIYQAKTWKPNDKPKGKKEEEEEDEKGVSFVNETNDKKVSNAVLLTSRLLPVTT